MTNGEARLREALRNLPVQEVGAGNFTWDDCEPTKYVLLSDLNAALAAPVQAEVGAGCDCGHDWRLHYDGKCHLCGCVAARLRAVSEKVMKGREGRCLARCEECGQCELRAEHEGKHFAGYLMWDAPLCVTTGMHRWVGVGDYGSTEYGHMCGDCGIENYEPEQKNLPRHPRGGAMGAD